MNASDGFTFKFFEIGDGFTPESSFLKGSNQELGSMGSRGGLQEKIIEIGFPVSDTHHCGLWTLALEASGGFKTGEPALTFFLLDGKSMALVFFSKGGLVSGIALDIH